MYKIGELSKLSKLPVKTLRYYDNKGILPSDHIDETTGYRYYNAGKLSDCYRIIALKELGFSLSEIKELLSLPKEDFTRFLRAKEEELLRLKAQTEERIARLQTLHQNVKENTTMFDIIIRKSDAIPIAYQRRILSDKSEYAKILQEMRSTVPAAVCGSRTVIIDYETEYSSQDFDTGFGVEITGKLPTSCRLSEQIISFAHDTANLICTETACEDGIQALHKYVLDHDYQIAGPVYQIRYEDGTMEIKLPVVKLGAFDIRRNEEIDLPFVPDDAVIGHWEMFDCLPCREMFHPRKQKSAITKDQIRELYFLPEGERYWCFGWTKGLLLSSFGYPHRKSQNKYTIEEIDGSTFLFVEFKASDYYKGGLPEIWIFRKTDSKVYSKREIMTVDEIPDLPAEDNAVMGKWDACDLVRTVDSFDPHRCCSFLPYEELYWRQAEFLEGGTIRNGFKDIGSGGIQTDPPHVWRWIRGYVICNPRTTASRYILRRYGNAEYLFIQWKSGDYSFGGEEPFWYVFTRRQAL